MNVVKITVLARDLREDLVRDYGAAGLGRCPEFEVGQEFLVTTTGKPDGFCSEAWDCIEHYVFALLHGADQPFFDGGWIRQPGLAINTCNDGLRPVTFRIERVSGDE